MLGFSISRFDLLSLPFSSFLSPSFLVSELLSFALLFQNQVSDSPSVLLILVVLSLLLSISSCAKLKTKLASTFLFFEAKTAAILADFGYMKWRFNGIIIKLGKQLFDLIHSLLEVECLWINVFTDLQHFCITSILYLLVIIIQSNDMIS